MEKNSVGQIIQKYREEAGLTQEELAEIIHVTKGKVAHWESNETIPRFSMVGRLIGALDIPDNELMDAVRIAKEKKIRDEQELYVENQAKIDADNAEKERLKHKTKALTLFGTGVAGFIGGCLLVFFSGSNYDMGWYFPLVIGAACAGIPFGWKLLTGDSRVSFGRRRTEYWEYEYRNRYSMIEWVFIIFSYLFLFFLVWLIGFISYPVVLLYHAYNAGKKGSVYRTIMFIIFLLATLFYGAIALSIIMSAF